MPYKMRFIGTNEGHTLFFFQRFEENGSLASDTMFDPMMRMFRPEVTIMRPVSRPVASLQVLYEDGQELLCVLPSIVARDLVAAIAKDGSPDPENHKRHVKHFFTYHGFKFPSLPMMWTLSSRYKKYNDLNGYVD